MIEDNGTWLETHHEASRNLGSVSTGAEPIRTQRLAITQIWTGDRSVAQCASGDEAEAGSESLPQAG